MRTLDVEKRFGWGAKVYPSGEFTLYRKQKGKDYAFEKAFLSSFYGAVRRATDSGLSPVWERELLAFWWRLAGQVGLQEVSFRRSGPDGAISDLGLSALAISKSSRRGLNGLTRHGKTLVREAAIGLESRYGKENLSFWTCTLPPMPEDDLRRVCENWSAILHNLRIKLVGALERKGLPSHIVGVTELQTERYEETGYPCWHIHWVFVGRHRFRSWEFTPEELDRFWREAVENWCTSPLSFDSACNVQRVKKTVGGYLAKYLSKGSAIERVAVEHGNWAVPYSWYTCTKALRDWVKSCTRTSDAIARWIYAILLEAIDEIIAPWAFQLSTDGVKGAVVCWLGRLRFPPPHLHRLN